MCGIAGLALGRRANAASVAAVKAMCARMARRGPDAEGLAVFDEDRLILGHRRLAIIDLDPRANQPMTLVDGGLSIVFNGEIYNFRELRRELQSVGERFRTTSDTEVVLGLYRRLGVKGFERLRGMFALAIWDAAARELVLARDPYGIKPLYYAPMDGGLAFASQVKALLASGLLEPAAEPAGLAGFYLWGNVPEPWTVYRGIRSLPAGCWMKVRDGQPQDTVRWHDIARHWCTRATHGSAADLQAQVRDAVTASVRAHLVADVPICVFLSGGIDSASVVGITAECGAQVEGVTVGFEEFTGSVRDEVPPASSLAAHYGLRHHIRVVTRQEFADDLPRILDAMDQPSVDGLNTWFASKAAAERGYKVALSGVGGDELFYGYSSFRDIPLMSGLVGRGAVVPGARAAMEAAGRWLARRWRQPKWAAIPELAASLEGAYFLRRGLFLPSELPALMGEAEAAEGLARLGFPWPGERPASARDEMAAVAMMESVRYLRDQLLRDSDWASMAHSLELRTPLVDATLVSELGPLSRGFSRGKGKRALARSPRRNLPIAVARRPKTGFALPMEAWTSRPQEVGGRDSTASERQPWQRRWAVSVARSLCGSPEVDRPRA